MRAAGGDQGECNTAPIPSEGPVEHTLAANDHPDGLGHSGDPEEEEVIVVEEPDAPGESGPPVVRAPRMPTQKEIDAHEVMHIPHEDWCEFCMSGRARNKPHRKKGRGPESPPEGHEEDSKVAGAPRGPETEEVPQYGLLLRIQRRGG